MSAKHNRWVELSVKADRGSVDDLVGFFNRYCTGGAVIEERIAEPLVQERGAGVAPQAERNARDAQRWVRVKGFLPVWDSDTRRKLEIALLLLGKTSPISEPRVRVLEPEDWAESWKAFFPPQQVGEHTVVVPTWREYKARPGETIIHLDPGMAFGTGLHATTRLCLVAVERLVQPGIKVLDVGTGSGILAILAALKGAGTVHAIDSDPIAVEVARENATLNGVGAIVQVERGTLAGSAVPDVPLHGGSGYDLLLVNILAEIIIAMAPAIASVLREGGYFVASGIIQEKATDVIQALEGARLVIDEHSEEDEWVALIGHRA